MQATNQPTKQATLRWERRWERKEKREEEEKRKKKMKRKERRKKNIRKICRFFTSLDDGDDAKEQWSLRTQVTIEPLRNNQPALNISLLELLRQLQFVFSGIVSTFYVFLYHFYPFSRFWSSQRRARLLLSSTKLCQGLTNKERFKQTQQEGRFFYKNKIMNFQDTNI